MGTGSYNDIEHNLFTGAYDRGTARKDAYEERERRKGDEEAMRKAGGTIADRIESGLSGTPEATLKGFLGGTEGQAEAGGPRQPSGFAGIGDSVSAAEGTNLAGELFAKTTDGASADLFRRGMFSQGEGIQQYGRDRDGRAEAGREKQDAKTKEMGQNLVNTFFGTKDPAARTKIVDMVRNNPQAMATVDPQVAAMLRDGDPSNDEQAVRMWAGMNGLTLPQAPSAYTLKKDETRFNPDGSEHSRGYREPIKPTADPNQMTEYQRRTLEQGDERNNLARDKFNAEDQDEGIQYSPSEIKGFRDKSEQLFGFQNSLNAYIDEVEANGIKGIDPLHNNKRGGQLDAMRQDLFFQGKNLWELGVLSKDDYDNMEKSIPDATGLGPKISGKGRFMAAAKPLQDSVAYQLDRIPEKYRGYEAGGKPDAPDAMPVPSAKAIAHLKSHPDLVKAFDKTYGEGAAAAILEGA